MNDFDPRRASAVEVGKVFGQSRQAIEYLVQRGCPRHEDGTFDLPSVIEWKIRRAVSKALAIQQPSDEGAAKERKIAAEAELMEIKLAEKRGVIVDAASVEVAWATLAEAVKADSRTMVSSILLKLGLSGKDSELVQSERREFLERVASTMEFVNRDNTKEEYA